MSKIITFKTPCEGNQIEERQGVVALLNVGDKPEKFVLQFERHSKQVECLTHFASGMRVGGLNDLKIRHMCAMGHNARLTDRQAAVRLLESIVGRFSAEEALKRMHAAPVINA